MEVEIFTLESIDAWDVVEREDHMNIINSTWAFKCKRYPDGLIKKFKARFCARGDQQLHGIDFFETYVPVVQWTTIRLMFVLEVLLGLKSLQGDITCALRKVICRHACGFFPVWQEWKEDVLETEEDTLWLTSESKSILEVHNSKMPSSRVGTVKVQSMLVYWAGCHLRCLC